MTEERQPTVRAIARVVAVVVTSVVLLYLIYRLRQPIAWLVAAAFIAVALTPPVNWLSQKMPRGIAIAHVRGRLQRFNRDGVEVVVDVGHNPQAARALSAWLRAQPAKPTQAVFAALGDKDSAGVVAALADDIAAWHLAGSQAAGPRGQSVDDLAHALAGTAAAAGSRHADVGAALHAAIAAAAPEGRVLVFGSFHAAAAGLAVLEGGDDGRG